jgi:hypothetical protein
MARFPIPRLAKSSEEEIAEMVDEACALYDRALDAEDEARDLVERAIEAAG